MGLSEPGLGTTQQRVGLELRDAEILHLELASAEGTSLTEDATVRPVNAMLFFRNTINTEKKNRQPSNVNSIHFQTCNSKTQNLCGKSLFFTLIE